MKCIVVSDNHGNRTILENLVQEYQGTVDMFIHCGDSELPSSDSIWQSMHAVQGNCDYDTGYSTTKAITQGSETFFVTHGHLSGVNFGLDRLVQNAKKEAASIAFYGHTHRLDAQMVDGILCINPGSICYPRGIYNDTPTYALVTIEREIIKVQFMQTNHQQVDELSFEFRRSSIN